jgi:hypothetical protein
VPSQHAGPLQGLQRLGNRAAGALRLGGDRLVGGEAAAVPAIMEAPQQRLQHVQEGPGDRPAVLARLAVPGAPGARIGANAGLGVAVQRHGTARTEYLLSPVTSLLGDQLYHERTRAAAAESTIAELRVRLDEAQAAVRDMVERASREVGRAAEVESDLRRELEAAQIALGEAQVDVEELRQAEDARKGRGLLAQILAAWRGG